MKPYWFAAIIAVAGASWLGSCSRQASGAPPADKFGSHMVKIDHVYDGDTLYFRMPNAWPEISMTGIRVLGIDAPEIHARCPAERQQALAAREAAQRFIEQTSGVVELRNVRHDKYGGRIEADVLVDGKSLASYELEQKLAVPYNGGHRDKMEWCQ